MEYTEEEKEVIEVAKKTASKKYGSIMCLEIKDVEIMLNLIEKQQKEIEEKDKLLKFNRNYINKLEQDLFENASNYVISKEAIREKIKELKDNRPYLSKFDDWKEKEYTNEDINNMCVEVLEDLLGDE